jgi:predicted alpha-1,6-mannanase (GH76 family)
MEIQPMRIFQIQNISRRSRLPFLAACLVAIFMAAEAQAVTPAEADAAFNSFNKIYWNPAEKFFRREETGAKIADFWFTAQIWDAVMDQYERTHSADVKRQIDDIYDGFIERNPDWTANKYNDDIMWWAIACTRAYRLTDDQRYLKKAQESFDFVYDNFLDDTLGGGLYWLNDRESKHSCINGPAAIAAVWLSVLLKNDAYLEKAKSLYAWQKKTLTDGNGKVFDYIQFDKEKNRTRIGKFSLTYNQGTFLGAAVLLYRQTGDQAYLDDAVKTAQWTKDNLCVTERRILKKEGQGDGDGGAFKGIFVRYMKLLIDEGGVSNFCTG